MSENKNVTVSEAIKVLASTDKDNGVNIKINIDENILNFFSSITILLDNYSNKYGYTKEDTLALISKHWNEFNKFKDGELPKEEEAIELEMETEVKDEVKQVEIVANEQVEISDKADVKKVDSTD